MKEYLRERYGRDAWKGLLLIVGTLLLILFMKSGSSSGQDTGFSSQQQEFDPPTGYQLKRRGVSSGCPVLYLQNHITIIASQFFNS